MINNIEMEILNTFIAQLPDNISVSYLLVFVLLSYGLRGFVSEVIASLIPSKWLKNVKSKQLRVYAVFLIALFLAPVWLYIFYDDPKKLIVTYAVGTSLYELIIQRILNIFRNKEAVAPFKDLPND